jgi:hypothetical protein
VDGLLGKEVNILLKKLAACLPALLAEKWWEKLTLLESLWLGDMAMLE